MILKQRRARPVGLSINMTKESCKSGPLLSQLRNIEDLQPLITDFVKSLKRRIEEMKQPALASDWKKAAHAAHKLKGAAGGYGFPEITVAAARIESCLLEIGSKGAESFEGFDEIESLARRALFGISDNV